MGKLRVAIVGAGFIASNRHIPAWRNMRENVEIVALSDLNQEMATKTARTFGIPSVYSDAADMLGAHHPDVIDICTPPATHAAIAGVALDHGCHTLIEKPMALSIVDCDAIVQQARSQGTKVCVGHTGLFYEPFLRARKIVEGGGIGAFRSMRVAISTPTDYMTSVPDHWAHKLPGGAVGETGPHAVYMSLAFLKHVRRVSVDGVKLMPEYPWSKYEDYRINLVGEHGISSISINYATNQWMVYVEVAGSEGTLQLDLHGRCVVRLRRSRLKPISVGLSVLGEAAQILKESFRTGIHLAARQNTTTHDALIRAFATSILSNRPTPVSPEEGREAVRVMQMIAAEL